MPPLQFDMEQEMIFQGLIQVNRKRPRWRFKFKCEFNFGRRACAQRVAITCQDIVVYIRNCDKLIAGR